MTRLETLHTNLLAAFGESATLTLALNELTLEVPAKDWVDACTALRDNADLGFDMCVDLCGIDYSAWGAPTYAPQPGLHPQRFAVVVHLLSIKHNWRLRVRAYVANDEFPVLPTLVDVWPTVNWFEREAFDLYGKIGRAHV